MFGPSPIAWQSIAMCGEWLLRSCSVLNGDVGRWDRRTKRSSRPCHSGISVERSCSSTLSGPRALLPVVPGLQELMSLSCFHRSSLPRWTAVWLLQSCSSCASPFWAHWRSVPLWITTMVPRFCGALPWMESEPMWHGGRAITPSCQTDRCDRSHSALDTMFLSALILVSVAVPSTGFVGLCFGVS